MTVTVKGDKEIIASLEKKYGKSATKRITDFALTKGGQKVVQIIKNNMKSFKDTGESVEETTVSKPMTINGVRTVKIHWRGLKQRYRIIHLSEYGNFHRAESGLIQLVKVLLNALCVKAEKRILDQLKKK